MAHCININHPEYKKLLEENADLNEFFEAAEISTSGLS